MEQPKARLTLQQHQQAINEAIWIDASPHEWPTLEKVPLLCNALLDSVVMVDYLAKRLAAVEAERDAARAEAEALKLKWKREECPHCDERPGGYQNTIWCAECFGWYLHEYDKEYNEQLRKELDTAQAGEARAVEALKRCHEGAARQLAEPRDHDDDQYALTAIATDCDAALADSANALDWLAQQRREAVAAWIEKEATKCRQQNGECYDRGVDCMLREAAALRAGEVPNE